MSGRFHCVISSAVMLGVSVFPAASVQAQQTAPDDTLEEVVVTGSRLVRPDSSAPIPVTSVNAEDIEASGVTLISDYLQELPMFGINAGRMSEIEGGEVNRPLETAGTERLNLRDLGVDRTLVVVNGRRHVGSTAGSTAVDVASIPTALIERVEISTGGASTAYGADAIAGVTNFIMKKDFEGIQIDSLYGDSQEGGGENKYLSLTIGSNFAEDRGNAVFSASYNTLGGIEGSQRSFVRERWGFVQNPLDTGPNDGQPSSILRSGTRGPEVLNHQGGLLGLIDSVFGIDGMLIFNDDGSVRPFVYGDPPGGGTVVGGDGAQVPISVAMPMQRKSIFGSLNYALTEKTNLFLEAKTYISDVQVNSAALLDAVIYPENAELFLVYPDNPFLPSSPLLDDMFARNFGLVTFMKYHDDLPLRQADIGRVLNQVVAGVEGETGFRDWRYEISGSYGRTTEEYREFNNRDPLRWRLATNPVTDVDGVTGVAPGSPVCRETLAAALAGGTTNPDILNCRPINLFGRGNQSQESLDYVLTDLLTNKSLEQTVVGASLTGTLFDELPAGSVSFAAGVEFRQERSETLPDNMQQTGQTQTPAVPATVGKYAVNEAYLEARLPLLTDAPFAELLAIEGGFRASDNDVTGSSNSWRAGGEWAPVRDIRFRGMYARAVRAPNISELFTPQAPRFSGLGIGGDPCLMNNVGGGPAPDRRLANCTEDLAALGLDPLTFELDPNFIGSSFDAIGGGNPNLAEEEATSITYGFVFQPSFLENLTVSVDFYDIEISGVITSPDTVGVIEGCYDNFDTIDNGLCALFERVSDPNDLGYGTITNTQLTNLNLARLSTSGIDFQAEYGWEIGPGTLGARLIANYIESYKEKPLEDAVLEDELVGGPRLPEVRGGVQLGYNTESYSVNFLTRYIDGARFSRVAPLNPIETTSPYKLDSETISDVSAMYRSEVGNFSYQLSLGVNNIFDQTPPPGSRTGRFVGGSPYYDPIGRFYWGGLRVNF